MDQSPEQLAADFSQEKDVFEKTKIIKQLRFQKKLSFSEISQLLQIKPSYISHYLRVPRLPRLVIDGYHDNLITATHLFTLARLRSKEEMKQAYEQVLARGLTSQQTDELVRSLLYGIDSADTSRLSKEEIRQFTREFHELYPGATIKLIQTRVRGKLICEIKGNVQVSQLFFGKLLKSLLTDDSGVPRTKKSLFVLE